MNHLNRFSRRAACLSALLLAIGASAQLTWSSRDVRYTRTTPMPEQIVTDTVINAWRGERIGAVALMRVDSETPATVKLAGQLKGEAHFTDFVTTDNFRACGRHPADLEPWDVADIIDSASDKTVLKPNETRPVWVTVEVPRNARAGQYVDKLKIDGRELTLRINVQNQTLPAPKDYAFYLDLWQQPYSVSRYYQVEPWSKEHFELLKPYARMLARAGQKAISAILIFEPWGEQSNDLFLPMVQTSRKADGTWAYDYDVFDRWVEFMTDNGVGPDIECFSMIPWQMSFRYFDEAKGEYQELKTTTDSPEYADFWSNFLRNFAAHVKAKGWAERTSIAMDERAMADMRNAMDIIEREAPGMKVSLAGNYHPEIANRLYNISLTLGHPYPVGEPAKRRAEGKVSTLYTCCSSPQPNLFSNSMPADAAWIPVYCTATGHDGYLHWSWMNWTDDPMHDSRFKLFAPGDTYFIYPDARSSVRFERLIEGIQLSEKLRLLKPQLSAAELNELYQALTPLMLNQQDRNSSTASQLNEVVKTVDKLSNR